MILKILNTLTCEATETEKPPESWTIYDNLSDVSYCQESRPQDTWDAGIRPNVVVPYVKGESIGQRPIVLVSALDKNDKEVFFWIATRAYLCNDNGKTIEKLVP